MNSIKKIFIISLLFSKITFANNVEQELTLDQKITNLEQEYLDILNLNSNKEESSKKLSILKYKAEKLLLDNSSLFKKVSLLISTITIPTSVYVFARLAKEENNKRTLMHLLPPNEFDYLYQDNNKWDVLPSAVCLYTAIGSSIYTCYSGYTLLKAYNQNNRLHLLIKDIESLKNHL